MWPFKKKKVFYVKYHRQDGYSKECTTYVAAYDIADAARRIEGSFAIDYAINIIAWEEIDKDGLKGCYDKCC